METYPPNSGIPGRNAELLNFPTQIATCIRKDPKLVFLSEKSKFPAIRKGSQLENQSSHTFQPATPHAAGCTESAQDM